MNIGTRLKTEREAQGLSIAAVSQVTRIHLRFLSAIENNDPRGIPPRPYGRGFVRAYAAYLGDDPEQTVRDFFAQFSPKVDAQPPRAAAARRAVSPVALPRLRVPWRPVAAVAAMCLLVGVLLVVATRTPGRRGAGAQPVGTGGSSAPVASGPSGPTGTTGTTGTTRSATAIATPPATGVTIQLEATNPAWVTASIDGKRALYRTMRPGERETLHAEREVAVRVGNAAAIRWQINGRPAAPMGTAGAVRSARVTVQNASTLH
jgi:transcriptional regulator with XRE-family HTH domain